MLFQNFCVFEAPGATSTVLDGPRPSSFQLHERLDQLLVIL
jgi:hypothetical protein